MNWFTRKFKEPGTQRPYTKAEAAALPCHRCNQVCGPKAQQWQICALNSHWHPICSSCDIELNRLVLEFMKFTDLVIDILIKDYRQKLERA